MLDEESHTHFLNLKSNEFHTIMNYLAAGFVAVRIDRIECDVDKYVEIFGEAHGKKRDKLKRLYY